VVSQLTTIYIESTKPLNVGQIVEVTEYELKPHGSICKGVVMSPATEEQFLLQCAIDDPLFHTTEAYKVRRPQNFFYEVAVE